MKRVIYGIIIVFFLSGNVFSNNLNELDFGDMAQENKLNSVLYISKEMNIDKYQISLSKGNEIKNSKNSYIINSFIEKIGKNKIQRLINNNHIEVLAIGSNEKSGTINFENRIILSETPKENIKFKFYTINPENYNWYTEARWLKNYPTIFTFSDNFLPQNLEVIYQYNSLSGGNQRINVEQKFEIIEFKASSRDNISYILIPYYEFDIPFNKAVHDVGNIFIIRYSIHENLIFGYENSIYNYEDNKGIGFIEIKKY